MRVNFFFYIVILIGSIHATAHTGYGQSLKKRVNIEMKNESLASLFNKLKEETGLSFVFPNDEVDKYSDISLPEANRSVKEVLDLGLKEKNLSYRLKGNTVFISVKEEKKNVGREKDVEKERKVVYKEVPASSPKTEIIENTPFIAVTGTVKDASTQEPLPGVNIIQKGTTNGTTTDGDGKYSLVISEDDAVLVFSFIGYVTQEIALNGRSVIDVALLEDVQYLSEVVVVGYGTQKKSDLTGSVSSFKLEDSPQSLFSNQNALDALRGAVPGVNIGLATTAGGQPSLVIRGQNSIYGSNTPLIVVDGVIFTGELGDINPDDIASYDILKDAVSSAVYGSRSANGIIAITTKKGKSEKPVIAFNASTVFKRWQNMPDLMNGTEYLKVFNARYGTPDPGDITVNLTGTEKNNYENGIETDWLDLIVRTGVVQDYQLAVSGAEKNVNYYLSSSYDDIKGVILGDDFSRISLLSKIEMNITNWLNIGFDANLSKRDYSGVAASYGNALVLPPWTGPYRNDQGDLEKYPRENSYINPLWGVNDGTRDNENVNYFFLLRTHAVVDCPWIKGLSYRMNFQNTIRRNDIGNFYHESYFVNEGANIERYDPVEIQKLLVRATGDIQNAKTTGYLIDNILNYKQAFGKHRVDATLVATRDKESYYSLTTEGKDYSDNGNTLLGIWGINKASITTSNVNTYIKTNVGYLGRLNYSYDDKYYVSGSVRRDGSSVFGENNKWGTFSAIGLGWRISEEDFFIKSGMIDNLKLRLSWGQNGNQGIGPYTTLSTVQSGLNANALYEFSDTPGTIYYGLYQNRIGNSLLGWESTEAVNTGFESAWLNNRLFLDLDIYFSKTTDQLFNRKIPIMSGFSSMMASMGQVNNKGIEVTARAINIKNNDWEWQTSLYFWKNFNKLVHLYGEDLDGDGKEDDDIANNLFIGHSLGAIYAPVQDGIIQEEDTEYIAITGASPGDAKYKDIDEIEGISASDRKILGYTKPNFKISIGNEITFRRFTLYALFSGTFGSNNYYLKNNKQAFSIAAPGRSSENGIYLPYWTPENRSNTYPSPTYIPDSYYAGIQSRSYLKLQKVSLSYDLGESMLNKIVMNSLKVFLTAENVFTITNWSGGDPEAGIEVGSSTFPVTANYSMGINMSF